MVYSKPIKFQWNNSNLSETLSWDKVLTIYKKLSEPYLTTSYVCMYYSNFLGKIEIPI